jgi:hypothetical protein
VRNKSRTRDEITAHADERRAEVYRTDVEFTGEAADRKRRFNPKPERVALAARIAAMFASGISGVQIAEELGLPKSNVFTLRADHRRYEAMKKRQEESTS